MKSRVIIGSSKITCPSHEPMMNVVVKGLFDGGSSGDFRSSQCSPIRGTVMPAGVVLQKDVRRRVARAHLFGRGKPGRLGSESRVLQVDLVPGRQRHAVEMEIEVGRRVRAAVAVRVPVHLDEPVRRRVVGRQLEQVFAEGAVRALLQLRRAPSRASALSATPTSTGLPDFPSTST